MTDTNASEAARTMRARRKHYDPAVAAKNLIAARQKTKDTLVLKPCAGPDTCPGGIHKLPCPVAWREYQANRRAAKNSVPTA